MARGIVVDNFAGGGGASSGIERALGRSIDYAINHDPEAIAMHRVNHPHTRHLVTNVMDVDPVRLAAGRRIQLAWFSPDCTFHSKARGGQPFRDRDVARRRRGLAWSVTTWAKLARPEVIMLENVEEFADWGPLLGDGKICPARRGMTFRRWHRMLENLGYRVDMRELRACDYGAPTTRKRLFIIARRDGQDIVFPEATHGPQRTLLPYRTAADCIDWTVPCPSIFERERPLADATLRRIARGIMRYVVNAAQPFIVPITHHGGDRVHSIGEPLRTVTTASRGEFALVSPCIAGLAHGDHARGAGSRVRGITDPIGTIHAGGGNFALVAAFLARHYGGHENDGSSLAQPVHTITARDHHSLVTSHVMKLRNNCVGSDVREPLGTLTTGGHFAEVRAFLLKYYGSDQAPELRRPLDTVTTKDRFGLVMVHGEPHAIVDIGMRMLTPRELFRAQSFPDSYVIDHGQEEDGSRVELTKTAQVRMCGNSVAPAVAEALVRANVFEHAQEAAA